jgi:hypothetical protein
MPPVAQEIMKNIKNEKERQFDMLALKAKKHAGSHDLTDLSAIFSNGKRKTNWKRTGTKEFKMDRAELNQAYKELSTKFETKKFQTMRRLTHNLGNPYSGNDGSLEVNELGQIVQA